MGCVESKEKRFVKDCGDDNDLAAVRKAVEENHEIINTAKDDVWDQTGLLWAARDNHVDILNVLIANKANLDMQNNDGDTALHLAAYWGYKPAAEILLDAGADWKITNNDGKTALDRAKDEKEQEVVKVINDWANKTDAERQEIIAATRNNLIKLHSVDAQERKEAEEQQRLQEEADAERARGEAAAERARKEAEQRVAAERARKEAEAAERARKEAEAAERARKEAEAAERARKEAEAAECARKEAEAAERARKEAEAARREAEERKTTPRIRHDLDAELTARETAERKQAADQLAADIESVYNTNTYLYQNGQVRQDVDMGGFTPGEKYTFADGTLFVHAGVLGSGNSTVAHQITIEREPKVMKDLQNDETMSHLVVTTKALSIKGCFPFRGANRRQDYDKYCEAKRLVDPDERSIDQWLEYVEETFSSWDVKVYKGRQYSIGASFDPEKRTKDPYRDILRFCYFYYLLEAKKLVHCDVAPRNVLVTWRGPVLIDFGCAVNVGNLNTNAMPTDVTPAYYSERRGRIEPNHDVKGFYLTACHHFGLRLDKDVLAKLDERNYLTIDEVVLDRIRVAQGL